LQPNNLTMDKELLNAAMTTQTLDFNELDNTTENIYESLVMISRRAEQINETIRAEIKHKMEEFEDTTESLEEVFENREQIEMSKRFESMPKPGAMATKEWLEGKVYYRYPEVDDVDSQNA
jgi:DNA-directed RNA polymerase subunit K/omega